MATILASAIFALHLSLGFGGQADRCVPDGHIASVYVDGRRVRLRHHDAFLVRGDTIVTSVVVRGDCVRATSTAPAHITINYS